MNRSKLKKRLRKKYKKGEFQQFGFSMLITYKQRRSVEDLSWSDVVFERMEDMGIACSGNIGSKCMHLLVFPVRKTLGITDEQKEDIVREFNTIDIVHEVETSSLIDMWSTNNMDEIFKFDEKAKELDESTE